MPSSVIASSAGEKGHPASEVGPIVVVVEVTPSTSSYVLVKRMNDEATSR